MYNIPSKTTVVFGLCLKSILYVTLSLMLIYRNMERKLKLIQNYNMIRKSTTAVPVQRYNTILNPVTIVKISSTFCSPFSLPGNRLRTSANGKIFHLRILKNRNVSIKKSQVVYSIRLHVVLLSQIAGNPRAKIHFKKGGGEELAHGHNLL